MESVPWFYIKLVFVRFQGKEGNIAHFICIVKGIKRGFPLLQRIFSAEVNPQNIETLGRRLQMLLRWGFSGIYDNNSFIEMIISSQMEA